METSRRDFSRAAFELALEHEVLLRPIGNTVYFMPPYIVSEAEMQHLVSATTSVLDRIA